MVGLWERNAVTHTGDHASTLLFKNHGESRGSACPGTGTEATRADLISASPATLPPCPASALTQTLLEGRTCRCACRSLPSGSLYTRATWRGGCRAAWLPLWLVSESLNLKDPLARGGGGAGSVRSPGLPQLQERTGESLAQTRAGLSEEMEALPLSRQPALPRGSAAAERL